MTGGVARIAALVLALACPAAAQEAAGAPGAVLRGLDKVAGASSDIPLHVGDTVALGRLCLTLHDCRQAGGSPATDSFAHLTIVEAEGEAPLFSGWMVASSPALNALDHARYDVWLLRCSSS